MATLKDYNTRIVVAGTTALGMAAGIIGTFMLLRKRSLMADALSHATLPGIGAAFIIAAAFGGTHKSLWTLLIGATVTGIAGMLAVLLIARYSRLKEDAALGIVLSVFFGGGVAILGIIQQMGTGHAAGLESFIYGKTASMLTRDAAMIGIAALAVATTCTLLFKEFTAVCFDQAFAASQGFPAALLDIVMVTLVVGVTVIGLQAVGLILMIALLVIPPAAGRFWTDRLSVLVVVSAVIGASSGLIGAAFSALMPKLPAGAVIVLVSGMFFLFSLIAGRKRGLAIRLAQHWGLTQRMELQHLLRAMYEIYEGQTSTGRPDKVPQQPIERSRLLAMRSWRSGQLGRILQRAGRASLVRQAPSGGFCLTEKGWAEARRFVRNHRLWELYLVTHADVATGQVDRDADRVEHVLGPEMIEELESILNASPQQPPSVHAAGRSQ